MLGCLMGFDILQDLRVNFDPLVKKKKKKKRTPQKFTKCSA